MTPRTGSGLSLIAIAAVVTCSPDERVPNANPQATQPSATAWYVSAEPTLVIGADASEPAFELARVRSAIRFGDLVQIANGVPPEIRIFDRSGAHVRTTGGSGDGPGEFRAIFGAWRAGDSLVIYDPGTGRITYFDESGALASTYQYQAAQRRDGAIPSVILGRFDDGSFMARPNLAPPTEADGTGVVRTAFPLLRVSPDASRVDTITTLPGTVYLVSNPRQGFSNWDSQPLSPFSHAVAHGQHVYVSDTEQFAVVQLDLNGNEVRRYERSVPTVPVRQSDWDDLMEGRVAGTLERFEAYGNPEDLDAENAVRAIRRQFREMPRPEAFPTHDAITVDLLGNVWIRHYSREPNDDAVWSVFAADGPFLGEVTVPRQLRMTEIGADYLLGVWTGGFDVQTVREFALTKENPSAS